MLLFPQLPKNIVVGITGFFLFLFMQITENPEESKENVPCSSKSSVSIYRNYFIRREIIINFISSHIISQHKTILKIGIEHCLDSSSQTVYNEPLKEHKTLLYCKTARNLHFRSISMTSFPC